MSQDVLKRAIELCLAVYRITDKFPQDEILRAKMRQLSIDAIECLVYNKARPTNSSRFLNFSPYGGSHVAGEDFEGKLEVLFAYFSVAERQGWVDARNFGILRGAYRDLYDCAMCGVKPRTYKEKAHIAPRQVKILEFLRSNEGGRTISEIAGRIQASNKTVERELKKMIAGGLVSKQGNTKGARFIIDK